MYIKTIHRDTDEEVLIMEKPPRIYQRMDTVPAGTYYLDSFGGSPMSAPTNMLCVSNEQDKLIHLKSDALDKSMRALREFLDPATSTRFGEMGITYKMGMLLFGPPGTGKTSIVNLLMEMAAREFGVIAIDVTNVRLRFVKEALTYIRKGQNTTIMLFVDEAEAWFEYSGNEVLDFLDGNSSVPGVVFVGCTNHLDMIDKRIIKRAGRIRHMIKVAHMPYEVFLEYARVKQPKMDPELAKRLAYEASEKNYTIDDFKALLIDTMIYGHPPNMEDRKPAAQNTAIGLDELLREGGIVSDDDSDDGGDDDDNNH